MVDEETMKALQDAIRYTREAIEEMHDSIDLIERTYSFMAEVLEREILNAEEIPY